MKSTTEGINIHGAEELDVNYAGSEALKNNVPTLLCPSAYLDKVRSKTIHSCRIKRWTEKSDAAVVVLPSTFV